MDFKKVQGPHVQVLLSTLALFPRILGGKLRLLGDDVRRDGNGNRPPRVGGPWKYWIGGSGLMAKRSFALGTVRLVFMNCSGLGRMEMKTTALLPPRPSAVLTLLTHRVLLTS